MTRGKRYLDGDISYDEWLRDLRVAVYVRSILDTDPSVEAQLVVLAEGIKTQHPRWTIVGQYIDGAELIAWPKLLEDADQGKLDAVLVRSCPWLDVSCMGDVIYVGKTGGTCLAVFMD